MSTSVGQVFQRARKWLQLLFILLALLFCTAYLPLYSLFFDTILFSSWTTSLHSTTPSPGTGLAVIDAIYVVSLPSRADRRHEMDALAKQLSLRWTYVDATPANDSTVKSTLRWVKEARAGREALKVHGDINFTHGVPFTWPTIIDSLALSNEPLDAWDTIKVPSEEEIDNALIPVATDDNKVAASVSNLPGWMILTLGRVACWQSHLQVIQRVANDPVSKTTLVLEDDVDMETDIDSQLSHLWKHLPADWDIVFLGHCWSNESTYPALSMSTVPHIHSHAFHNSSFSASDPMKESINTSHRLHPSVSPKCTHAYALSHTGARRLLLHLQYPPFAFSRAIDQAFAWLIRSGRLKSFSIIPSLVVQRKISRSDINFVADDVSPHGPDASERTAKAAKFRGWKEDLMNGVFGGVRDIPRISASSRIASG